MIELFGVIFNDTNLYDIYEFFNFDKEMTLKFLARFSLPEHDFIIKIPSRSRLSNAMRNEMIYDTLNATPQGRREIIIKELAKRLNTNKQSISRRYNAFKKSVETQSAKETIEALRIMRDKVIAKG